MNIPAVPGFWADYYVCFEKNLIKTINYMLDLHKEDFPNTACVGFTIKKTQDLCKIYPKVIRKDKTIYDFYPKT